MCALAIRIALSDATNQWQYLKNYSRQYTDHHVPVMKMGSIDIENLGFELLQASFVPKSSNQG